jgi:phenylacetyl-CoA:acceptor oxidoreductase
MMNTGAAAAGHRAEGDWVEVVSDGAAHARPAALNQGIRPDTLLIVGQFDHWATPYAKDLKAPS